MAMLEVIRTNDETQQEVLNEVYASLQVSNNASLQELVKAVKYREGARRSLSFGETPADTARNEFIYRTSILDTIEKEVDRLALSGLDERQALTAIAASIKATNELSLDASVLRDIDEQLLDKAIEVIANDDVSPLKKGLTTVASLFFAAEQRGVDKPQMLLARRLVAQQAAHLRATGDAREKIERELDSIKTYFYLADLDYHVELIDSKFSTATQRAAELAQARLERARDAIENGAQIGRRAAAATVLVSVTLGSGATMAAADTNVSVESGSGGGDAAAVQVLTSEAQAVLETPIAAVVAIDPIDVEAVHIDTEATSFEPNDVVVVESLGDGEVAASTITIGTAPAEDLGPITVEMTEPKEGEALPPVSIGEHSEDNGHNHGNEEVAAAVPAAVESSEPKVNEDGVVEPSEPIRLVAPNNDVNVAVGETPQEAITRIVGSRDMKAASFAIRQNYGGIDVVNQPAVNETLKAFIAADVEVLKSQIPETAHADTAYTEKAFMALAYLDAVTHTPSLLDNPEVAAFIASITDQGEDYRNKLFAKYLAEAKAELSSEEAGAYANVPEQYRASIETLYGYVAMAAMNDEVQAHQIQEIKDEEARIAAEEEAKRKAAELAAQGVSEIEAIAADEKRLALTAIDRAEQQGLITPKYAAVYRLVIDQEGPGAMVAAAGMVGNCMAEADGCNPVVVERGNGIGFGIFQWSFGRRDTLEATAAAQGVDVGDIGFQVRYAIAESKNRTMRDSTGNEWAGLMSQSDPAAAAEFWRWNFERPKDHLSSTNTRIRVAQEVFAHVTGQMDAIRSEAAAAKAERERIAAEAAAAAAAEAERQRAAAAQGDIRPQLANGLEIRARLEEKYGNVSGHLDGTELTERNALNQYGEPIKIYLFPDAAPGYDAMAAAYQANFGEPIRVTDHYRDYNAQVRTKAAKGDLAAKPGKSNHGWGMALDLASNINQEGSPQHEWMEQNAHKFGWVNPTWAHDGTPKGGAEEPWHWEFDGNQATFETTNN